MYLEVASVYLVWSRIAHSGRLTDSTVLASTRYAEAHGVLRGLQVCILVATGDGHAGVTASISFMSGTLLPRSV